MKINGCGKSEKTNPTCRGVASGEAGFKPKQTQSPKSQNERKLIYSKGLQKKR